MTADQPRSRRALLSAGIAGAIGSLAAALGRPISADATVKTMSTGTDNAADAETRLYRTNDGVVFSAFSPTMPAFQGSLEVVAIGTNVHDGIGIRSVATGVYGIALGGLSTGSGGTGVYGNGPTYGVQGESNGWGVVGRGLTDGATGVQGIATGAIGVGVRAEASQGAAAIQADAVGGGVGARISSDTGPALVVSGRTTFNRSGRANVAANASSVDVTVPGGLAAGSFIVATIQANRSGVYVRGVRLNYPSAGMARIYLNTVASTTATTPVGWIAFG